MESGRPRWSWAEGGISQWGHRGRKGDGGGDPGARFLALAARWNLLVILIELIWGEAWAQAVIKAGDSNTQPM